jgi:2',3'-cyclic-nucleotide 2'-phosphodiesterase (5'-nucleotidase family)
MDIVGQSVHWVDVVTAGTNYDNEIQTYIEDVKETLGDPILAVAGETITNTDQLQTWVGNVMIQATNADIAISNTGGIRSTGGITAGNNVTLAQLYEISPFDNAVVVMEMTYEEIQNFVNNSALFYTVKSGLTLQAGQTYRVSIIDYVYYWSQLDTIRSSDDIETGLYIRDLLVEDIQTKGDLGETFKPISDPSADIEVKVVYYD